jgi:hypothetical protein
MADAKGEALWRRSAEGLFHFSLGMFLLGFVAIGASALR